MTNPTNVEMYWQTLAPVPSVAIDSLLRDPRASVVAVGDPSATRTVYTTIVVLVALGVVLVGLAVWVWRRTRPEPELLAPLEVMQTRGWRKLDPAAQRRLLDESRPDGAVPLQRSTSAPAVDSSFATVAPVASFDDLSETDDADADVENGRSDGGSGELPAPGAETADAVDRADADETGEIADDDSVDLGSADGGAIDPLLTPESSTSKVTPDVSN